MEQKLIVIQLLSRFMEPEGSLQCSQEPATRPYPEPDASSPYLLTQFPQNPFYYYLPYLRLDLSSSFFPSGFPNKILYEFLIPPMHAACPASLTFPDLIHNS
jgi:hypothetical protein